MPGPGQLGLAAGIINLLSFVPYIAGVLRGKVEPERISWLIWVFEYVLLVVAQWAQGGRDSVWLAAGEAVGCVVVFALSVHRYFAVQVDHVVPWWKRDMGRGAVVHLVVVAGALVAWYLADSAAIAIVLAVVVDMSAAARTASKTYRKPSGEPLTPWLMHGVAGLAALAAVGGGPVTLYLYPVSVLFMVSGIVGASLFGRPTRRVVTRVNDVASEPADDLLLDLPSAVRRVV